MRYVKLSLVLIAVLLLVMLPACTRAATESSAVPTFESLSTSQAQTVEALATMGVVVGTPQPTSAEAALLPAETFTPGGPTAEAGAATSTPVPAATATTSMALPTPTTGSAPAAAPASSSKCDAVGFIADVTVPDNTQFQPNTAFTKTWRLKNIGTCTWTTAYKVDFVKGELMSATYPVSLTGNVAPGQTVDVSVNMVAPATNGTYQGYWALRNASGALFGLGANADVPFWVKIVVGTSSSTGSVGYDFVASAPSATWTSQTGALTFPGTEGNANGYALKIDNAIRENGSASNQPGLQAVPNNSATGYIQGVFGDYTVKSGDRFKATVNCPSNASGCNLYFRLDYIEGGVQKTYWSFREKYEGYYYNASIDLSPLAGRTVKFVLMSANDGTYSTNDKALWIAPRIENGSGTTSPTPVPGSCTNKVAFIADVTVPDNTQFQPNTAFTKTWRLKNVGTCTWTNYTIEFASGEAMSAKYPVTLAQTAPGYTVDVSVNMVSPANPGTYKGNWVLKSSGGQVFALGAYSDVPFWVQIVVVSGSTTVTPTPVPGACTNKAGFISDVTVPDNTVFKPSTAFTKTWRLKNVGTCTWTSDYVTTFISGDGIGATYPVALGTNVTPGQTVDVSVNMVAPATDGTYKGNWGLKTPAGQTFGLGTNADVPFWVQIKVSSTTATATPVPGSCTNKAAFVSDLDVPDNTQFTPGAVFTKTWRLKNVGTCTWNTDYKMVFVSGDQMNGASPVSFTKNIAPGQTVDLAVQLTAPTVAATYKGNWGLQSVGGQVFGLGSKADVPFYVQIVVVAAVPYSATPTITPTP